MEKPAPQSAQEPLAKEIARPDANAGNVALLRRSVLAGGAALLCGLAAFHFSALAPRPDVVPWDEAQRRAAAFARFGSMHLPAMTTEEARAAVGRLGLPEPARAQLAEDAEANRVRLVWLSLYDSDTEDGDAVEIRSGTFRHTMVLTRAPVAVAIPVINGQAVMITGTIDGAGGGVTVGVVTPQGPLPLPPLSVGQTITLPVMVR